MDKFSDVMRDKIEINRKTLGKLLLLLFIFDFKNKFPTIIDFIFKQLCKTPDIARTILSYVRHLPPDWMTIMWTPQQTTDVVVVVDNSLYVDIELQPDFIPLLYKFLKECPSQCSFREIFKKIYMVNSKDATNTIEISNVTIDIDDYHYVIDGRYDIQITNGKVTGCANTAIHSIKDFLTPEQYKCLTDVIRSKYPNYLNELPKIIAEIRNTYYINLRDYFTEFNVIDALQTKHPTIEYNLAVLEAMAFNKIISDAGIITCTSYANSHNIMVFDPNNYYLFSECKQRASIGTRLFHGPGTCTGTSPLFRDFLDKQKERTTTKTSATSTTNRLTITTTSTLSSSPLSSPLSSSPTLTLSSPLSSPLSPPSSTLSSPISSPEIRASIDASAALDLLFKTIGKHTKVASSTSGGGGNCKIKINTITLVLEETTVEKPNPEYASWQERKELFDTAGKEHNMDRTLSKLMNVPPKTITERKFSKKLDINTLNEVSKNIDTLFLKQHDKEHLLVILNQFKDNKQLLVDLGFQNKLNILLHGEPGTGKSTTIQAVATYLCKDIYYVDIKEAQTNGDLKMMFDHVNKNANGAIVVMEDIDAMTKIVLNRSGDGHVTTDMKVTELGAKQNETELTLEFFLNILQGTLTLDDSIFIVTTNHIEHLDPAFYRDGRFDVRMKLECCDHYQIQMMYRKLLRRDIPHDILNRIAENKHTPATILFHLKQYILNPNATDIEVLRPFLDSSKV